MDINEVIAESVYNDEGDLVIPQERIDEMQAEFRRLQDAEAQDVTDSVNHAERI